MDMGHLTRDTWHVTPDMWHLTCDMWQLTYDTWWGVNIISKFQLPSSYGLEERAHLVNEWMNYLITKVIVEQPRLHRVF